MNLKESISYLRFTGQTVSRPDVNHGRYGIAGNTINGRTVWYTSKELVAYAAKDYAALRRKNGKGKVTR